MYSIIFLVIQQNSLHSRSLKYTPNNVRSITPLFALTLSILVVSSCNKDDEQRIPVDSNNRVHSRNSEELQNGITNISEVHTMAYKNSSSVMTYEYQASATPPALDYSQTSATSILRNGNLVYIGWHTHDPANYNGFAKYSGAVTCYEVTAGTWTQVAQLEFDEMDIHEIALGAANELYIVGQSNPDASTYPTNWGHRGAIIGKVQLDGSGHPISAGYIEKPLTSFGANSLTYVSASEIYVGTGAYGGHLYKLDNNLSLIDSTFLNNVKSVNRNDLSGDIGILRGNRGRQSIMAKFYEFSPGGALPAEGAGIDLTGITTFIHERNEGDYYNNIYLSSSNQGLVAIDPSGPSVNTVYTDGLTIGVAADEVNEVIYVAAQNDGLKVIHGTGTPNEYDVIGTFAPPSLNSNNWYVGDVVYDQNNVFMTSGARNVIFTEIYPDTYYLNLSMSNDRMPADPSTTGKEIWLTGGLQYSAELLSSSVQFGAGFTAWEGVHLETLELDAVNDPSDNYMTSLNGIGDLINIDLSHQVGPLRGYAFFTPGTPEGDDAGSAIIRVKDIAEDTSRVYTVDMTTHRLSGDLSAIGESVDLPPGRYEFRITSSSVRFGAGQGTWTGAFLYTLETATGAGNDPTDYYQMTLNGTGEHIIDLSNKVGNTTVAGYLVADDALGDESGTVVVEIRELHN